MTYHFRPVERDQEYLLPPSLKDWLPADELAWFVLDLVDELDVAPFRARYRADGWGAAAFEPRLMVALLLYAYATGERSSRRIEALCRRDIAYRVICANQTPDHATIARFRVDHAPALEQLFGQVLALCARAGLVRLGLIALDGTKIAANASLDATRGAADLEAEIRRILEEAAAVDVAEDAAFGPERRGHELPPDLAERGTRLARLREARRQIDADQAEAEARHADRVAEYRAAKSTGGSRLRPPAPPRPRIGRGNPTDPDSRAMRSRGAAIQGYNGQLVATAEGIAIAAEVSRQPSDQLLLGTMLAATTANLVAAAVVEPIGTLLADGGYWSEEIVAHLPADRPALLVSPRVGRFKDRRGRLWAMPERDAMLARFEDPPMQALYRRRAAIIEPLFGQLKEIRRTRRFQRRGLNACRSEWKLLWATHNVLKLWRSGRGPALPAPAG